jgi:hypothetical protein
VSLDLPGELVLARFAARGLLSAVHFVSLFHWRPVRRRAAELAAARAPAAGAGAAPGAGRGAGPGARGGRAGGAGGRGRRAGRGIPAEQVGAEPPPPDGAASGGRDKPDAPDDPSDSEAEKSLGDAAQEGSEERGSGSEERGSDEEDDEEQEEEEEEQGDAEDSEDEAGSVAAEGVVNEGAHLDEDRGEEREEEAQQEEQEGEEEARSSGPATSHPTPGQAATPCCGGQLASVLRPGELLAGQPWLGSHGSLGVHSQWCHKRPAFCRPLLGVSRQLEVAVHSQVSLRWGIAADSQAPWASAAPLRQHSA